MDDKVKFSKLEFKLKDILDYNQVVKATSEFYNQILPEYNLIFPKHQDEQERLALFLHENYSGKQGIERIFDVACGNGALLNELSRLKEYELHGTDSSEAGIVCARALCGSKVVLKKQDWLNLRGRGNFFDVLLCTGNSIAHVPPQYLEQVIEKFSTFVKPHGLLIIDVYNDREWDICEKHGVIPRSCVLGKDGYSVVFFDDCFGKKRNVKFTLKAVNIMEFNLKGLPRKMKKLEVIQFIVKPVDLLTAIRSTRRFLAVKEFVVPQNDRFTYFAAQRKEN